MATAAGLDGVPVFKFPGWRRKGVVKVNILVLHVSMYAMFIYSDLLTGRGPGAVQECGGGAQCYALLLTVHSAGGGQPSTIQVKGGFCNPFLYTSLREQCKTAFIFLTNS